MILIVKAKDIKEKLKDFSVGSLGINEWHNDYKPHEKGHRHFSPLYGVYPGTSIDYFKNPEMIYQAKKLLDNKCNNGSGNTGWSAAWAACLYARMRDEKGAVKFLNRIIQKSVFLNLFGSHPPFYFQIDANFGYVAAVNEMLMSANGDVIELLPAIPNNWNCGSVTGIVFNGAVLEFDWESNKITRIYSNKPVYIRKTNIKDTCVVNDNIRFWKN